MKTKKQETKATQVLFQTKLPVLKGKKLDKLQKKLGIKTRAEFLRRILLSTLITPANTFPELSLDD